MANAVALVSNVRILPTGRIAVDVSASAIAADGTERNLGTSIEMDFLSSAVQIRNTLADAVKSAFGSSFGITFAQSDVVLVFGAPL